jgi:hypothetical protein
MAVGVGLLVGACTRGSSPPVPAAGSLQGTYRAFSGPNILEFKGSTWTLTTGERVFSGKFVATPDELVLLLTFANHPAYADFCKTDLDAYTWSLADGLLTLRTDVTTAAHRSAGRACNTIADQVFRNGPWTKTG